MTEPWGGYPPEVNAGRYETGTGPATWVAASQMWLTFAGLVMEAAAVLAAQMAMVGTNWTGLATTAREARFMPFMGWLAQMEVQAITNGMSCAAVATAYAAGTGSMIPQPVVTQNRITEAMAEATNFFGVNTGLIAALNAQYAEFWGQNGATMMTYDAALMAATAPKPISPPPPLASAAMTAADTAGELAQASARAAQSGVQEAVNNLQQAQQPGQTAAQAPTQMMSMVQGMMGPLQSLPQMAGQMLQSGPQQLMQPLQQLMSAMGGNLGQGGGADLLSGPGTLDELFGAGGAGGLGTFAGAGAGGLGALGAGAGAGAGAGGGGVGAMGGGGGAGGIGGGVTGPRGALVGNIMKPSGSMELFSGISQKSGTSASFSPSGMAGAGGVGPMGGMHGMRGETGGSGVTREIRAAQVDDPEARALAAEAEKLFDDR